MQLTTLNNNENKATKYDKAGKSLVNWLKDNNISFENYIYFNGNKTKFTFDNEVFTLFFSKKVSPKYLGLSNSIKSKLKKRVNIEIINNTLPILKCNNSYIYKPKDVLSGWEYDLSDAYPSMLLYLYEDLKPQIDVLFELKKKNKEVAKQLLGMILLGSKIYTKVNEKGNIIEHRLLTNELTSIFYLIRYLIIKTFEIMLAIEFRNTRLSFFIDAIQLTKKVNTTNLAIHFETYLYDTFFSLNEKFIKYTNSTIFNIFGINENIFEKMYGNDIFKFKENYIYNIIFSQENGIRKMIFTRENKVITYKLSM